MSTEAIQLENTLASTIAVPARASERLQQQHYDTIAQDYEAHYSDEWSRAYRHRFIYDPMFAGLDLAGASVLDAMCGSGQTTEYLLARNARVTGLDISNKVIESFRNRWTNCEAVQCSMLDSQLPDGSFDCVTVIGGLHHIHPHVKAAVSEIHRILKPGGHFCFMEPHSQSLPDMIRRVWYKHDRFFSDNEASIDMARLEADFADVFTFKKAEFRGNAGFLLVLNSLIFRVPLWLKPIYSPAAMKLEALIAPLQRSWSSCFVVARWQKKP